MEQKNKHGEKICSSGWSAQHSGVVLGGGTGPDGQRTQDRGEYYSLTE